MESVKSVENVESVESVESLESVESVMSGSECGKCIVGLSPFSFRFVVLYAHPGHLQGAKGQVRTVNRRDCALGTLPTIKCAD